MPLGGLAGGLLGGLFGGGDDDPAKRARRMYSELLWGAVAPGMSRDINAWEKLFRGQIYPAMHKNRKAGYRAIKDWRRDEDAGSDQRLAARGMYNTSLVDNQRAASGEAATRMKSDLAARYRADKANARLQLQGIKQGIRDKRYGLIMGQADPSMFNNLAWQQQQMQMGQQFGGALGQLFNWQPGAGSQPGDETLMEMAGGWLGDLFGLG